MQGACITWSIRTLSCFLKLSVASRNHKELRQLFGKCLKSVRNDQQEEQLEIGWLPNEMEMHWQQLMAYCNCRWKAMDGTMQTTMKCSHQWLQEWKTLVAVTVTTLDVSSISALIKKNGVLVVPKEDKEIQRAWPPLCQGWSQCWWSSLVVNSVD